ncbi:MAG: hypothetical protein Q7R95_06710 [bacterium]|nr:hypothetical protein [bacterium]
MDKIDKLEIRIIEIEKRNQRVEQDKYWETSLTRRFLLMLFTYLAISFYMKFILNIEPWLNAIIPSLGFLLSTLTLPFFKNLWDKYIHKRNFTSNL